MGSTGSGGGRKYVKHLTDIENDIWDDKVERLVVMDKDGNDVLDKNGLVDKVSYRDEITENPDLFRDKIATHNHPSGSSFSWQDVATLVRHGLQEMRAVGSNGKLFRLVRTPNASTTDDFWYDFYSSGERFKADELDPIWLENERKYRSGQISETELNQIGDVLNKRFSDYDSKWLKENAKKYGYNYIEGRVKR